MNSSAEKDLETLLEAYSRKRAAFAGTVSHDLKTPLNAVIGFSSVLMADSDSFSAEQNKQLSLVYDSAKSLLDRINRLLDFYRLEGGRVDMGCDWFALAEFLQVLQGDFHATVESKFFLKLDHANVLDRIHSNQQWIRKILDELIQNAIRFGQSGEIVLQTTTQDLNPNKRLRFSVIDSGPGPAPDVSEKLNRSLGPSRPMLERSYEGLGLGLAMAREAAYRLGGYLEFSHQETCCFSFVLDLLESEIQ